MALVAPAENHCGFRSPLAAHHCPDPITRLLLRDASRVGCSSAVAPGPFGVLIEPDTDSDVGTSSSDVEDSTMTWLPFESLDLPSWVYEENAGEGVVCPVALLKQPSSNCIADECSSNATIASDIDEEDHVQTEMPFRSLDLPSWAYLHSRPSAVLIEPELDISDDEAEDKVMDFFPFQSLSLPDWAYAHMQPPQPRLVRFEPEVGVADDDTSTMPELPFQSLDLPEWACVHAHHSQTVSILIEPKMDADKVDTCSQCIEESPSEPSFYSLRLPEWMCTKSECSDTMSFETCDSDDEYAVSVTSDVSTAASTPAQRGKKPMSDGEVYASFTGAMVLQTCILAIAIL